jgi:hypothetical protein
MSDQEKIEDIFEDTITDPEAQRDNGGPDGGIGMEAVPEKKPMRKKIILAALVLAILFFASAGAYFFIFKGWKGVNAFKGFDFSAIKKLGLKPEKTAATQCPDDILDCKDGTYLKRQPPLCKTPECPAVSGSSTPKSEEGENVPLESEEYTAMHDKKMIAGAIRLRSGLKAAFIETGSYPPSLEPEHKYGSSLESIKIDNSEYQYRSFKKDFYAIYFNLTKSIDALGPGRIIATPDNPGANSADADSDGLDNIEEAAYQTDKDKPDSDNDGFGDLSELESGHDPLK